MREDTAEEKSNLFFPVLTLFFTIGHFSINGKDHGGGVDRYERI